MFSITLAPAGVRTGLFARNPEDAATAAGVHTALGGAEVDGTEVGGGCSDGQGGCASLSSIVGGDADL